MGTPITNKVMVGKDKNRKHRHSSESTTMAKLCMMNWLQPARLEGSLTGSNLGGNTYIPNNYTHDNNNLYNTTNDNLETTNKGTGMALQTNNTEEEQADGNLGKLNNLSNIQISTNNNTQHIINETLKNMNDGSSKSGAAESTAGNKGWEDREELIFNLKNDLILDNTYPHKNKYSTLDQNLSLIRIGNSHISKGGRGIFAKYNIPKGKILGIYAGTISNKINAYSLEIKTSHPIIGKRSGTRKIIVDGTPTGFLDNTAFALMNEYIWETDGDRQSCINNIMIDEMGVIITRRKILRNEELCTEYGNAYDWDHVKLGNLLRAKEIIAEAHKEFGKNIYEQELQILCETLTSAKKEDINNWRKGKGTDILKALIHIIDGTDEQEKYHNTSPKPKWENGLLETFENWLNRLFTCKFFPPMIQFRNFNDPRTARKEIKDWPRMPARQGRMHLTRNATKHCFKEMLIDEDIMYIGTNNSALLEINSRLQHKATIGINISESSQGVALYEKLERLYLDVHKNNGNHEELLDKIATANLNLFSWSRPFQNCYGQHTDSNGFCGWLAMEQLNRRTDAGIPECLHLSKIQDRLLFLDFLIQIHTTDDKTNNTIQKVYEAALNYKDGDTLDRVHWMTGDIMRFIEAPLKACIWQKMNNHWKAEGTGTGGYFTWTNIREICESSRHMGYDGRHYFLTYWNENEATEAWENAKDVTTQLWSHFQNKGSNLSGCVLIQQRTPFLNNNPIMEPTHYIEDNVNPNGNTGTTNLSCTTKYTEEKLQVTKPDTTTVYEPAHQPEVSNEVNGHKTTKELSWEIKPDTWRLNDGYDNLDSLLPKTITTLPTRKAEIRVLFFNINGISVDKLQDILFNLNKMQLDVLVLLDTRLSRKNIGYYDGHIKRECKNLKLGWTSHITAAKQSNFNHGHVGGQLWLVNNRINNCHFANTLPYGALTTMTGTFGKETVTVAGTYWPCKAKQITTGDSLWNQLRWACNVDNPIHHIKETISKLVAELGNKTLILGGDFNSDMNHKDTHKLLKFMDDLELKNAAVREEKLLDSYRKGSHSSRIDHIFIKSHNCNSLECRPHNILDTYDDHLAMIGIFKINASIRGKVKLTSQRCPIINRKDVRIIRQVEDFLEQIDPVNRDPEDLINQITMGTAKAAGACIKKNKRKKDGWSATTQALAVNLRIMVLLKRHTDGAERNGCRQWTAETFTHGKKHLLKCWHDMIASLTTDLVERRKLANISHYGWDYWEKARWKRIKSMCGVAIKTIMKELHGRKRKDRRMAHSERTKKIEIMRQAGQIGAAIKILSTEHSEYYTLEELKVGDTLITDPIEIANRLTEKFANWVKNPGHSDSSSIAHKDAHWKEMNSNCGNFIAENLDTKIPIPLLLKIYKHTRIKQTESIVLERFQKTVMEIPSFEEFNDCIKRLPDRSAPGMSGLNYDGIKLWDNNTRLIILEALIEMWKNKTVPKNWTWRWLVPIPKCPNPTLNDLRPLVLIEALRKVWAGIFVHRINCYLADNNILCCNQHGFLWGKSVESASMILMNALETACEWRSKIYISSWDMTKAFDSVPTQMLIWSLIRLGVPTELAEYLVNMDRSGLLVVRTPRSMDVLNRQGIDALQSEGLTFSAGRGTGQGDKTSPLLWNAFCDILLCMLQEISEDAFNIQDHCGNIHEVPDIAYADDILSLAAKLKPLQLKAIIISAFTIFMGMEISTNKLRAFEINWGNEFRPTDDEIIIYGRGWTPTVVPIKSTGDLKHLGIIWGMDLINNTQLDNAMNLIQIWCNKALRNKLSKSSKKVALEHAIFPKIIFYARFASWNKAELSKLDKTISIFIRTLHHCAPGMPEKLIYLSKELGGLGHKKLSFEIGKAKLALFWRLLSKEGNSKIATLSCVGRGLRAAGQPINGRNEATLADPLNAEERWWIHTIADHLQQVGGHLSTQGNKPDISDEWHGRNRSKEQRITLNQMGISNTGELLMETDDINQLLEFGITPPITECPDSPLTLRVGQCWSDGHSIWEIIGWWDDHTISVIEWKPRLKQGNTWTELKIGSTVYLSEEHFCNGAGSKHRIDADFLTTWTKYLINLGMEEHRRDGSTSARIKLIRKRTSRNRQTHNCETMPPWGYINLKFRDIYTDGTWIKKGNMMDHLDDTCRTHSGGAVVLETASSHEAPTYKAIYIEGTLQCTKSAYVMELLAICVANDIKQQNKNTGYIRSDCKAAINKCKRIWDQKASFRSLPNISLAIASCRKETNLVHVPSHPEIKKPNHEWLDMDCGIYAADAAADGQVDFINCRTTDTEVIKYLTRNLECVVNDNNGILMEDMEDNWHKTQSSEYLKRRDMYRAMDPLDPRPPKWEHVNPRLMSKMWGILHTNTEAIGYAVKMLWDWNCTGSNRKKGNADGDYRCQLCGCYETQAHIITYCKHPDIKRLRTELLDDCRDDITLMKKGKSQDIAWALFHLLENKQHMSDLCTGIITPTTRTELIKMDTGIILSENEWKPISKVLRSLGQFGRKICTLHGKLTARLLSGKSIIKSGLTRSAAGPQRSIQAAFGWQNTNHNNYCRTISTTPIESWSADITSTIKTSANVHNMIRWHRVKPTVEMPISLTRVKRKHMGAKMKALHDLTHATKIKWHKFERIQPKDSQLENLELLTQTAEINNEEEEEEPEVKRRRISRNVILDDEECTRIISRTKYGTWKPNRTWNEHRKVNFAFMKSINSTSGNEAPREQKTEEDEAEQEATQITEPIIPCWPKFRPKKFNLQGETVDAIPTKKGQHTEVDDEPEEG